MYGVEQGELSSVPDSCDQAEEAKYRIGIAECKPVSGQSNQSDVASR